MRYRFDPRWNRFWLRRVSGLGRPYGWMVFGRRIASLTVFAGTGQWQLHIGPMRLARLRLPQPLCDTESTT